MVDPVLAIGAVIQHEAVEHDVVHGPAEGGAHLATQLIGDGIHQQLALVVLAQVRRLAHSVGLGEFFGIDDAVEGLAAPDQHQQAHKKAYLDAQGLGHHTGLVKHMHVRQFHVILAGLKISFFV